MKCGSFIISLSKFLRLGEASQGQRKVLAATIAFEELPSMKFLVCVNMSPRWPDHLIGAGDATTPKTCWRCIATK